MIAKIFSQKYKLLAICVLAFLGAAVYSNTFYSSFHFDDIASIVENPAIRNILNLQRIWNFWPTRFITYFSVAINYHLSQLSVFGYHFFNLTIHIISAILVWWFMLLTFSTPAMKGQKITRHAQPISLFVALVFLTHPIQTQAVTYIIQRATSLATLFYLACLILYVKSRLLQQQGASPKISKRFYFCSLIAAMAAIFSKEMAVTLPFMVLFYECSFLKTKQKLNWKYIFPFFSVILIIPLTMLLAKSVDLIGMHRASESIPGISPWQYLVTQFRVIVTYLRLLFLPINQNLDYDYHIVKSLLVLPALFSFVLLAIILAFAIKVFSKYRLISFGIIWVFLTLLPESSIIPIRDVIFEHRLYLPMAGFSVFLVSTIYYIFVNKSFKPVVITLMIIISFYAILTYRRNFIWKDELTLWNDIVNKSPQKARAYNSRGVAYNEQNNFLQAISDFNKALTISSNDGDRVNSYYNRGLAYGKCDNLTRAISDFNKAIEINPKYADAYCNRGVAYNKQDNLTRAISDFNKAIEIKPGDANAYYNRGVAYGRQDNFPQAISDYTKAIEIDDSYTDAYNNRGVAYYHIKDYDKAWADVHKVEKLGRSVNPEFLNALRQASARDQ